VSVKDLIEYRLIIFIFFLISVLPVSDVR